MNTEEKTNYFYSGGFAEIVSHPSLLTYSFMQDWFCGRGSLGEAMELLGLPYERLYDPILERVNGEMVVNLKTEEKTLYQKTIFSYRPQVSIHSAPKLGIRLAKLLLPTLWRGTVQILMKQSEWIGKPEKALSFCERIVKNIPEKHAAHLSLEEIDSRLYTDIWPPVLATGILSEFFNQYLLHETKQEYPAIQSYMSEKIAEEDWFFTSLTDQLKVKEGSMSFDEYLTSYGNRSDIDYELSSPRWHEIPDTIKLRISQAMSKKSTMSHSHLFQTLSPKIQSLVSVCIELQLLRSEAKRKALGTIDLLRSAIIRDYCSASCSHTDVCTIKNKTKTHRLLPAKTVKIAQPKRYTSGKGIGVSLGKVMGTVRHVTDANVSIKPGTIGIFPNASPEFSMQFPKCDGMIFLRGGQTSHGAIVAREYGIPSLIDERAASIPDGVTVVINGSDGEWKVRSDG